MIVSPSFHFSDEAAVPARKSVELPLPPERFRMRGEALSALGEYRPEGVQLGVFTEEMLSAESFGRQIPDPHMRSRWGCSRRAAVRVVHNYTRGERGRVY